MNRIYYYSRVHLILCHTIVLMAANNGEYLWFHFIFKYTMVLTLTDTNVLQCATHTIVYLSLEDAHFPSDPITNYK